MDRKPFYITTTLPYVNADPHIGFALEIIRADVIARYKKLAGYEVFFNTGTDEHGLKILRSAEKNGVSPQSYVDSYAEKFRALTVPLGLSPEIHFIRTTDIHHIRAAQEFWKRCADNGYIYKKEYSVKYCVGCELEKTDSELVNGHCPLHPNQDIEFINQENYFFKFSAFQKPLLDVYDSNPNFVVPDSRMKEIKSFVARGLEDFSISRLKEKMPWGVAVPDDDAHVMYVWFDALVNYISTLGWPENAEQFNRFWKEGTPLQYAGKDNLRQQSAMWQAMLMAAGLSTTHTVVINGFITAEGGQKMSKSLGNVIDPIEIVNEYGTDALRYFVLREINSFEDSVVTKERIREAYNGNLVNGLGNLVSRIMKMVTSYDVDISLTVEKIGRPHDWLVWHSDIKEHIDVFDLKSGIDLVFKAANELDVYIQQNEPFKLIKTEPRKAREAIQFLVEELYNIADGLVPFLPETAQKITNCLQEKKVPETPLFPRK